MIFSKLKISALITLIFLVCAFGLNKLSEQLSQSSIDKISIENVIHHKEQLASAFLTLIKDEVYDDNFNDPSDELLSTIDHYAKNNQLFLAVYKNWNLKIWPSQKVILPDVFDPDIFDGNLIHLGFNYYVPTHARHNNTDIIILTFVKSQFNSTNKYLESKFASSFHLANDVKLAKNPLAKNIIFDSGGNFLFSLESGSQSTLSDVLYWLALLLFLAANVVLFRFIESLFEFLYERFNFTLSIFTSIIVTIGIRVSMILWQIPAFLQKSDLFNPELYAANWYTPSMGDSLLNVSWIFFIILLIYFKAPLRTPILSRPKNQKALLAISGIILSLFGIYASNFIPSLIANSSIEFEMYRIIGISGYTFLGLLIGLTLISCYLLLVDISIQILLSYVAIKKVVQYHLLILVVTLYFANVFWGQSHYNIPFFVAITLATYYYRRKNAFKHSYAVIIIFTSALYFVLSANYNYDKKWIESKKVQAYNLTSNIDLSTEHLLLKICDDILLDTTLNTIISTNQNDFVRASNYINNHYFSEISRAYNVGLLFFNKSDSIFVDTSHKQWQPWRNHYDLKTKALGSRIEQSHFYRMNNSVALTRYIGIYTIPCALESEPTLVIELDEKSLDLNNELHSVLLTENIANSYQNANFSYANYFDGKIISKHGKFDYRTTINEQDTTKGEQFTQKVFDNHRHLIYQYDNNQTLIISEPIVSTYDLIIWFSYIFVSFYIILVAVSLTFRLSFAQINLIPSIQNRIQTTMAIALFISIFAIGAGSMFFNFQSSERQHMEMINEKIRAVVNEVSSHFSKVKELYKFDDNYISFLMRKYSTVFNIDVTLYDVSGNLVATSRRELFDEEFINRKMNFQAFQSMTTKKLSKLTLYENIGTLNYYSAYAPLLNSQGTTLGFINLPFFGYDDTRTRDLTSMFIALINIYVLLILLAILLAVFVSNKVTKPLLILRKNLQELDIKKENTPIEYNSNDEIGDLVREYNRMVNTLSKNTETLAQHEREVAWQSMARQVAHEIKNPLTPMKLNVQLLERAWEDRASDFDKRLHKVCNTLIEQIDALSNIAGEFSAFAKMPKEQREKLDVYKIALSCVHLFEETENLKILVEQDNTGDAIIWADSNQIIRVFTNLIKNAVQSIPEERLGVIRIDIVTDNENVTVSIADNGDGILPEIQQKLFQPNFTTKNSGMGLGLAMVRNIITGIGGTIWYDTTAHEGTTFFIQIPKSN